MSSSTKALPSKIAATVCCTVVLSAIIDTMRGSLRNASRDLARSSRTTDAAALVDRDACANDDMLRGVARRAMDTWTESGREFQGKDDEPFRDIVLCVEKV